jgi:hypothetical protein
MAKKPTKEPEVVQVDSLEVYEDTFEPDPSDSVMTMQILTHTRDPMEVRTRTLAALTVLEEGRVPPSAVKTRPGSGSTQIQYASHIWTTRTLNAAFRWLWNYECLEYTVHDDGSVSSRNRLTIHVPIGMDIEGKPIWHIRTITEIGSFEAYHRMKEVATLIDGQERRVNRPMIDEHTGKYVYTMNTADRVASSVSRGLVKAMGRAFNVGFELSEKEEEVDAIGAWNILLRFGKNQGLTREEIIEVVKAAGLNKDNMLDKFQVGYAAVYNAARKQMVEDIPDEL